MDIKVQSVDKPSGEMNVRDILQWHAHMCFSPSDLIAVRKVCRCTYCAAYRHALTSLFEQLASKFNIELSRVFRGIALR